MSIKSDLRKEIKAKRKALACDKSIHSRVFENFIKSNEYKKAKTILAYASLDDEISTDEIIIKALNDKKCVALPYCIDNDGNMDFYVIKSFDDLKSGSFGVREPDLSKCELLTSFEDSIIIVPGLCFDKYGYRLGYGKGFYDRFLQKHTLISFGLCYNDLIIDKIPRDKYDLPVDYIITETNFLIANGGENG